MKLTHNLPVAFTLILILSACAQVIGNPANDETTEAINPTPVLDENIVVVTPVYDGPNQVSLALDETLVVQIPTIPKEGYEWVLFEYDPAILVPKGEGVYIEETDPDSAGGIVEFRFTVVGSGESILNFVFQNKAEGVLSDTYGLTVTVPGDNENRVVITPDPTGPQMAELKVGQEMVIELPTIPEEGYDWFATDLDETVLIQIGQAEYIADSSVDSAGGVTRLLFEAIGSGDTNLNLAYAMMTDDTSEYVSMDSFGMSVIVAGDDSQTMTVTLDSVGQQTATLNVGDMLVVEVPTIPEEDFNWVLPYLDTNILSQIGESEYVSNNNEASDGGMTRFEFKAVGLGETNLAFDFTKYAEDMSVIATNGAVSMTVIVK